MASYGSVPQGLTEGTTTSSGSGRVSKIAAVATALVVKIYGVPALSLTRTLSTFLLLWCMSMPSLRSLLVSCLCLKLEVCTTVGTQMPGWKRTLPTVEVLPTSFGGSFFFSRFRIQLSSVSMVLSVPCGSFILEVISWTFL
jgi:hypothetical protein